MLSLRSRGVDVFCQLERSWCFNYFDKPRGKLVKDNVAVAEFDSYMEWYRGLPSETKKRLEKAAEKGLEVQVVNPHAFASPFSCEKKGERLAEGIWRIYNETPVRQGRSFLHYGVSLDKVKRHVYETSNTFVCAYLWQFEQRDNDVYLVHKLVGFAELQFGDCTGAFSQILSLASYREYMPNNALIAKAVKLCVEYGCSWLIYARMGNHPSLDEFKKANGFSKCMVNRYYVPLSVKGKAALACGLHRNLKDVLPEWLKLKVLPVYNRVSRLKGKLTA